MSGARYVPIIFTADGDNALSVVSKMTNAFSDLDQKADSAGSRGLRNVFIQADLVSRAIATGTREVVDAAKEYLQYGRELANLNTLLDNNAGITTFRDGLLDLDPALGQTSELARGMYQAISSGVDSGDALTFIADSAKTARAGLASTFETVDAGTSVMASFGIEGQNVMQVYDRMFETVKRGKVEMPQLAQSIGAVTNIAAQTGVTLDEMFAAIATSSRTIRAPQAIEGFRSALSNIIKPSEQALEVARRLGVEFSADALKRKGFAQFLNDISTAAKGNKEDLAKLFGDVQALSFIMSLTGNQAKTFASDLKGISQASGVVDEAFEKQKQSIPAQLEALKVSFQQGLIKTLLFLEPVLKGGLALLTNYPGVLASIAVAVLGLVAAYKIYNAQLTITTILQSPLVKGIQNVIFWMVHFRTALTSTRTALTALAGWGGLAIMLGALALSLFSYESATEAASKVTKDQVNAQAKAAETHRQLAAEAKSLAGAQNLSSSEHERMNAVLGVLAPETENYIRHLTDEKQQVKELTKAIEDKVAADKKQLESQAALFGSAIIEQEQRQQYLNDSIKGTIELSQIFQERLAAGEITQEQAKTATDEHTRHLLYLNDQLKETNQQLAENKIKFMAAATGAGHNRQSLEAMLGTYGKTSQEAQHLGDVFDIVTRAQQQHGAQSGLTIDVLSKMVPGFNLLAGAVDNTASSVRGLNNELAELGKTDKQRIDSAVLDIARKAKDRAEAQRMAREDLKNKPELQESVKETRRIKETTEGARSVFEPSTRSGAGSGVRRQSAITAAADRETQLEIKKLDLKVRAAERAYREETAAALRSYNQRDISLKQFTDRQIKAETDRAQATLNLLRQELTEAQQIKNVPTRDLRVAEVNEKITQAESEKNLAVQKLRDDAARIELDSLRAHQEELLKQAQDFADRSIESLRASAEARTFTYEQAEQKAFEIQQGVFNQRLAAITAEQKANVNNVQEFSRLTDAKQAVLNEEARFQDEHYRRLDDARMKDAENMRLYFAEIEKLELENLRATQELREGRIDQLERLGADPRAIKHLRSAADVDAENLYHREHLSELKAAKDSIALSQRTEEEKARLREMYDARIELEVARHTDVLREIEQRPLEEFLRKVEDVANNVGDVLANSFDAIFDSGKSFWKEMVGGFGQMGRDIVKELIKSKVKEFIMSLFKPQDAQASSAPASGGGGLFSGLLNGIKGLFNPSGSSSGGTPPFIPSSSGDGGGGLGGIIKNFKSGGFIGGFKNLLGLGSTGASTAASATGAAAADPFFGLGAPPAMGASGGGLMSSMGALLTNPWTAVVAGGIFAGVMLWRHFRNGTEKKLKEAIQGEYGVMIKDMPTLKQIKEIGEQSFGKGNVKKHLLETIRLDPSKEIISGYAEQTGQTARGLTTNKQYEDPGFKENQFVRRAMGGPVQAGQPYIVGDSGPRQYWELFVPDEDGYILPRVPEPVTAPKPRASSAQPIFSTSSNSSRSGSSNGNMPAALVAALTGALSKSTEVIERLESKITSMRPGDVVGVAKDENPEAFAEGTTKGLARSTGARSDMGEALGLRG